MLWEKIVLKYKKFVKKWVLINNWKLIKKFKHYLVVNKED